MDPQSGEDTESSSVATSEQRGRVGVLISVGALLAAAVHLIWPTVKIDAVTLVLVGLAVAPWLAPIFKSIELPGGLRFEYQQIQRQVREVERRVEGVERLVFSGDTTPRLEQELTAAVLAFAAYLRRVEPTFSVPPPSVHLRSGLDNAQYVDQRIELDPEFAEDEYAVQREYAHHVLRTVHGFPLWDTASGFAGLESGLVDYLIASYTGDPGLGQVLARLFRRRWGDAYDKSYIRNLANDVVLHPDVLGGPQEEGEIWGAAFWELRAWLGQTQVDQLLVKTWLDESWMNHGFPPPGFPAAILSALPAGERDKAREIFKRRGLPILEG
jgi:hypothetical protein